MNGDKAAVSTQRARVNELREQRLSDAVLALNEDGRIRYRRTIRGLAYCDHACVVADKLGS